MEELEFVDSLEELKQISNRRHTSVRFICPECKKEKVKNAECLMKRFLCKQCVIKQNNIKKYGYESYFQTEEFKQKARLKNIEKFGVPYPSQSQEIKDKVKQTCLEHFGTEYSFQAKEVRDKIEKTNIEKFGYPTPLQNSDVLKKMQETNLERYGYTSVLGSPEYIEKRKQHNLETFGNIVPANSEENLLKNIQKFGCKYPLQSDKIREKCQQTLLEKTGYKTPFENPKIQNRINALFLEKYNGRPLSDEQIYQKMVQNNIDKYGVANVFQDKAVQEKIKNTLLSLYGTTHFGFRKAKVIYDNIGFDSYWELEFYKYHKALGHSIKREPIGLIYTYDNKEYTYYPDFEIDGQLYEIKGDFFIENGKMICPFDRSQDGLYEAKHQCGLNNNVIFLFSKDLKALGIKI